MMKYNRVMENEMLGSTRDISINSNTLLVPKSDDEVHLYSEGQFDRPTVKIRIGEFQYSSCFLIAENIVLRGTDQTKIIGLNEGETLINNPLAFSKAFCDRILFLMKKEHGEKKICAIDFSLPKVILWESTKRMGQYNICKENLIITSGYLKKNILFALNLDDGNLLWEVDLRNLSSGTNELQMTELNGILGIIQDYCILALDKDSSIVSIDNHSGKVMQYWHTLPDQISYGPHQDKVLPTPSQSVLNQEEGIILGLTGYYYWEIDLKSGEIRFSDLTGQFKTHRLRAVGKPAYKGDHLFFASDFIFQNGANSPLQHSIQVAAFNRRTHQVDWQWEFEHPGEGLYQVRPPVVHGNFLYVTDTKNVLHIFKEEKK